MTKAAPDLSAVPALPKHAMLVPIAESCAGHYHQFVSASGNGIKFLSELLADHVSCRNRHITFDNRELESIADAFYAIGHGLTVQAMVIQEESEQAIQTYRGENRHE